MRLVIRYLSPFIRSRRRISFLLTIGIFSALTFILFVIDHDRQSKISIEDNKRASNKSYTLSNNLTTLIPKSISIQK